MAKYDKKAALKIMIEAAKKYEEKLNDKHFLIVYREGKEIKTVSVGFRDMNFLHMTGVKTRLSAQQFYVACLESKLSGTSVCPACNDRSRVCPGKAGLRGGGHGDDEGTVRGMVRESIRNFYTNFIKP